MLAYIIWAGVGCAFIVLGVCVCFLRKQAGFFSNVKPVKVEDVRGYNIATGKLWCAFGFVFCLVGLPLTKGQNSPLVILSVFGVVAEVLALMIIYLLVIEPKYKVKK